MDNPSASELLKETIKIKELELQHQEDDLKLSFLELAEDFKPINLIKNSVTGLLKSDTLKNNFLGAALGLASTFINNQNEESKIRPIKKILGGLMKTLLAGAVAQNPEAIKTFGNSIIEAVFSRGQKNNN